MFQCRYCQITLVDSETKDCPGCGTVNGLRFIGGYAAMKPEKDSRPMPEDDLDKMMGLTGDPYGSDGIINSLHDPLVIWVGSNPEFRKITEDIEARQVEGIVSHITGIGWRNDLDLGLALLMEAQK